MLRVAPSALLDDVAASGRTWARLLRRAKRPVVTNAIDARRGIRLHKPLMTVPVVLVLITSQPSEAVAGADESSHVEGDTGIYMSGQTKSSMLPCQKALWP
mmetsp:Transcript_36110/g.103856  ORF Transcript_36110/g.103856 Transcript_36110/m.103856 type:complete len:101 (+) Transcript_36110:1189-1491(+)